MSKCPTTQKYKLVIIKVSVREQWKATFQKQLRDFIDKKAFYGYPKVLMPEPALTKTYKRKDR